MTTKYKIISGFLMMILLIGVMAFIGYSSLQKASDNFGEYRRLARFNVLLSDGVASMNDALGDVLSYVDLADPALLASTRGKLEAMDRYVKDAEQFVTSPERRQALERILSLSANLRDNLNRIESSLTAVLKQYQDSARPAGDAMSAALMELAKLAQEVGNADTLYEVADSLDKLASARMAITRYSETRLADDGARAKEAVNGLRDSLPPLKATVGTQNGMRLFNQVETATIEWGKVITAMVNDGNILTQNLAQFDSIHNDIAKAAQDLSAQANDLMATQGSATLQSNENSQSQMLGISIGGIIAGALLAGFISFGIIRILAELGRFAEAIAEGRFDYQVTIREKGEIGHMVKAMQAIPATLKDILTEYQGLEQSVESGSIDKQGDASRFKGDFATIVRGTNNVLSRFLALVENIPSPVVVLNKDLKIAYLNMIGRDVAGEDFHGKTCVEVFAREDNGTPDDALIKAVQSRRKASGETRAHPRGSTLDISYTAIPMLDAKGNVVSTLQLITDLTHIKDTQRKIQNVASQASSISNRVAAASEELSAQVAQVSRGAEMQRERVQSTAAAMSEMNATVLEVARSAGQASDQSEKTRSKADDGSGLVTRVVGAINNVVESAREMHTNMTELGMQAESIGGVMNVISDIADQTNLLALNAAIEAARAGEAGRGFAVVADEVRKLAEKTMEATREVGSNISSIQETTRLSIAAMEKAVSAVTQATELAGTSGAALSEIVDLASTTSNVVASIATAAEEQSATSEEINKAIEEINMVVGETTEGMIQASSAVQELSQMAQELNRVMDELPK